MPTAASLSFQPSQTIFLHAGAGCEEADELLEGLQALSGPSGAGLEGDFDAILQLAGKQAEVSEALKAAERSAEAVRAKANAQHLMNTFQQCLEAGKLAALKFLEQYLECWIIRCRFGLS